ncbi:MAG: lysoplasmalogenase [Rhizobiaceae bacterium]|nr:lysoplasmalogenase [Rhizobiaceae bacterium]
MILLIASIIALIYGIFALPRKPGLFRSLLKTLPVLILAFVAFIEEGPALLIAALALSAAGDAFLSRNGNTAFLAGLVSFLSAHLAYVALFLTYPSPSQPAMIIIIAVWAITALIILAALASLWRHLAEMKIPVIIYTLVIGAMNIAAWASGQEILLLAGVALFVFSDLVLAHEMFVWKNPSVKKIASRAVWFSYFPAQLIILVSFLQS